MKLSKKGTGLSLRVLLLGGLAGALAVLVVHQPVLMVLDGLGVLDFLAYPMRPTAPFGVPQIVSWTFWGGVWGVIFAMTSQHFPRGAWYWVTAFVAGAVALPMVAWFVVMPLRGQPVGGGWEPVRTVSMLFVHGLWGLGTIAFLELLARSSLRLVSRGA